MDEKQESKIPKVLTDALQRYLNSGDKKIKVAAIVKSMQALEAQQRKTTLEIDTFISSDTWQELKEYFPDAGVWLEVLGRQAPKSTIKILSAAKNKLPDLRSDPSQRPPTFTALAEEIIDQLKLTPESIVQSLIDEFIKQEKNILSLQIKRRIKKLDWPLDKVNSKVWNLLESQTGKQLKIGVEKAGSDKKINVLYSINFAEAIQAGLKISSKLNAYDQRVYTAVSSLYTYQGECMTVAQIYYAMGYDSTPSAADKGKINNSLSKMKMAQIFIDNKEEAKMYKRHEYFTYDGYLLPLERVSRIANGAAVDNVIHLLKRPPLYSYAVKHKQLTTIPRTVLVSPLNKTTENLTIEAYLIERIARIKGGKGQRKMLYKTIYEHAGIESKSQRSKAKSKITQLLEHYKNTGFINGWTQEQDGIFIK